MMKIKNFKCDKITPDGLKEVEDNVNNFTSTHNVIDIKVTSCCNSFGWLIIYAVIYKEQEELHE